MLGRNIKYYRLQAGLTQAALAEKVGLQKMAICNYENDNRTPDTNTIGMLCEAMRISVEKLLDYQDGPIRIDNGDFRRTDSLTALQQEAILSQIECIANRYEAVAGFLGHGVIDSALPKPVQVPNNASDAAAYMREILGLAPTGPIGNLTQAFENVGVLVLLLEVGTADFSGYGCWAANDTLPIIAINNNMVAERQRFTLAHELAHLVFRFQGSNVEKKVDDIAGKFLLPATDILRELGAKRTSIGVPELSCIHDEYGVSIQCASLRIRQEGIISAKEYDRIKNIRIQNQGIKELPTRLQQLVCRAFFEGEIGIAKVAELLGIKIADARRLCNVEVAAEW